MSNLDDIRNVLTHGDKEEAIKMLFSALRLNGNDVESWLLLGEVIDDPAKKRDCYNQVLKLSPNNPLALDGLRELEIAQLRLNLNSSDELRDTQPKIQIKPSPSNTLGERVRRAGYEPKPENLPTPSSSSSTSKEDWKMAGLVILGIGGFLGISYVVGLILTSADSSNDSNPLCMGIICLGLIAGLFIWYSSNKKRGEVVNTAIQEQKQTSSFNPSLAQSNTISCRACQHTVSRTAPSCPNCGELYPGLISKCPHCGSNNIRITPKGFSLGKATAGAVIAGPLGIAGGLHGRKDLEVKCSSCNRTITIKSNEIS